MTDRHQSGGPGSRSVRIITRLFTPEVGAAAFRQRNLADAFAAAGCQVEVLTTRPPGSAPAADDGGLRVRRWPVLRDRSGNVRGYLQYLSFDIPLLIRNLRRPPDLYVVEPPPTTGMVMRLIAAVQRRPYIWYAADVWSEAAGSAGAPRPLVRVLEWMEGHVLRHARLVLSISDGVSERLLRMGVDEARLVTVGNGVDTSVFTPDGTASAGTRPYLVYTGTMSEWQGAGVFIEALRLHRARGGNLRILFLGQGSELDELRKLADRSTPAAVDFGGVVPPAEAAARLRGARAGLVSIKPGLGYDFAVPTKIFAATATGTPVVFAGTGAGAGLVREARLGWASDYDPKELSEIFDAVAADPRGSAPRPELVEWTRQNASLAAKARSAARRALAVLR